MINCIFGVSTESMLELTDVGVRVQVSSSGVTEGNVPVTLQHVIGICWSTVYVVPEDV